jgi:DNA-binding MurR/RpiR family transcriptional regulator
MRGPGEKLTRKQEVAIAALLTAPTIADAAHAVSISEPTLWRWLQRKDFQTAYRKARREAVSQAVAYLQRVAGEAVDTLRVVMRDSQKPASARISAARAVLELAIRGIELEDLEARLQVLEQCLADRDQEATLK